ncbi:hypothetical protein K7X08_009984 [Anisodus acutangulus]|uniref:Uncharacterized protein n=1 Tax=Anisodus acutangulus TaxID=402998 RepID=A0A9Q1RVA9_9SOLA|nr:hypothetical protein K7X08_009984 [Anisodus acutangulus]
MAHTTDPTNANNISVNGTIGDTSAPTGLEETQNVHGSTQMLNHNSHPSASANIASSSDLTGSLKWEGERDW